MEHLLFSNAVLSDLIAHYAHVDLLELVDEPGDDFFVETEVGRLRLKDELEDGSEGTVGAEHGAELLEIVQSRFLVEHGLGYDHQSAGHSLVVFHLTLAEYCLKKQRQVVRLPVELGVLDPLYEVTWVRLQIREDGLVDLPVSAD